MWTTPTPSNSNGDETDTFRRSSSFVFLRTCEDLCPQLLYVLGPPIDLAILRS
ncbi:hypothetical protein BC937DRAFT_86699 [Endogone sp. FLAS-F59071]|nr:hypothetical protein BC937DRAFT_86699 [Endogone sp. FLAS-F59071]|eukprot:RUS19928.1 hypothetical protein BC937DRAFT_86699 [Endogone sp. FLAS-F59071]